MATTAAPTTGPAPSTDPPGGTEARTTAPYVIALANQKGGAGKSLLALGLAAVTADAGGRALLLDIDPQSTVAEVAERAERAGTVLPFDWDADTDPAALAQVRRVRGVDLVVIDCPGSLEGHDVLGTVLAQADLAVIPYVHDPFYVTPTRRTAAACKELGVPYRVLINRVDGRRGAGPLEDARATLDKAGLPFLRSFVREYAAHSAAHAEGQMITTYRGDRNAVHAREDIRRVHAELLMLRPGREV